MNGLCYNRLRPAEIQPLTGLTPEEFEALIPRFEKEYRFHMSEWTLEGKPRVKRRHATYRNCPLPAAEDRLLFVLIYLKNNPVQVLHGRLFGLPQGKTNMWLHALLPALRRTLAALGANPTRSMEELANRLNLPTDPPLFVMTEPSGPSSAPRTTKGNASTTAAKSVSVGCKWVLPHFW